MSNESEAIPSSDEAQRLVEWFQRHAHMRPQDFVPLGAPRQRVAALPFRIEEGRADAIEQPAGGSQTFYVFRAFIMAHRADGHSVDTQLLGRRARVEALLVGDTRYVIDEPVEHFAPDVPGVTFVEPIKIPPGVPLALRFRDVRFEAGATKIGGLLLGYADRDLALQECQRARRVWFPEFVLEPDQEKRVEVALPSIGAGDPFCWDRLMVLPSCERRVAITAFDVGSRTQFPGCTGPLSGPVFGVHTFWVSGGDAALPGMTFYLTAKNMTQDEPVIVRAGMVGHVADEAARLRALAELCSLLTT